MPQFKNFFRPTTVSQVTKF